MLSGLTNMGESMFSKLGIEDQFGPGISEMEQAAQAVQFNKTVSFQSYNVRTFDTSDKNQREEYTDVMMKLQQGVQAQTHVVWYQDRRFLEATGAWLVHMEWAEYELKVEPVAPIGSRPEGDTDG
jgi:hypothetical protein